MALIALHKRYTMNISDHLKKDYWKRRITPESGTRYPTIRDHVNYRRPCGNDFISYQLLTQEDLMDEIAPSAHKIMSEYRSRRPIYSPTGEKDPKTGKEKWAITGYDDIEQVSLGLQKAFSIKKASHFAGKGFWIANENKPDELYQRFKSWTDKAGLQTAYMDVVLSCFQTGDGAIYLYQRGNDIEYKVFSKLYGDTLYPDEDADRNPVLYRQYVYKNRNAVDVYNTKFRETWVMADPENEEDAKWLSMYAQKEAYEKSEDGYIRIYRAENQVGNDYIQAIYFRVNDIPSGVAQGSIEALERALSYVAEEVKSSAFPMLFAKAENIKSLPSIGSNGKTLVVTGGTDNVKNADAKFLTPPDASNIADLNIKKLTENIIRSTMSVFIEPEILKQGSDSSTTIKIMFVPEIQWCQTMWTQFYHPVKELVEVFKRLVGKVEGKPTEYASLMLSVGQEIWLPQNEKELVEIETNKVYAKIQSREAAMDNLGNQHIGDYEQIRKETADDLDMKARIPAVAKAEVEKEYGTTVSEVIEVKDDVTPDRPRIDKNAAGRSIAE